MNNVFSDKAALSREKKIILKNVKNLISFFSQEVGERNPGKYENLQRARKFIFDSFTRHGHTPVEQTYRVEDKEVANIEVNIKGLKQPNNIVLIGAHYDTVLDSPGADDNASALAALCEFFRLMSTQRFKKTIRFVAFTLEEPPYFSSKDMGSMRYAANCFKKKEKIDLMVSMDMIGFSSNKIAQDCPSSLPKNKFPKKGNFLAVISFPSVANYVYLWKKIYNSHAKKKIYDIIGPASIPGVSLSDHYPFIQNGFPAILLSDTAFYRNKNYHTAGDKIETINFNFLVENIMNIYLTLCEILNLESISEETI